MGNSHIRFGPALKLFSTGIMERNLFKVPRLQEKSSRLETTPRCVPLKCVFYQVDFGLLIKIGRFASNLPISLLSLKIPVVGEESHDAARASQSPTPINRILQGPSNVAPGNQRPQRRSKRLHHASTEFCAYRVTLQRMGNAVDS